MGEKEGRSAGAVGKGAGGEKNVRKSSAEGLGGGGVGADQTEPLDSTQAGKRTKGKSTKEIKDIQEKRAAALKRLEEIERILSGDWCWCISELDHLFSELINKHSPSFFKVGCPDRLGFYGRFVFDIFQPAQCPFFKSEIIKNEQKQKKH